MHISGSFDKQASLCLEKYPRYQKWTRIPHGLIKQACAYLKLQKKSHPSQKFIIFGQGRSGTTLLRGLMNQHPEIQCDGELLYDPVFFPDKYIACHLANSRKPCYGLKFKIYQLTEIQRIHDVKSFITKLHTSGWKIIYLKRNNILRQAISNQYASRKGKFFFHKSEQHHLRKGKVKINGTRALKEAYEREYYSREEDKIMQDLDCCRIVYERDLLQQSFHQRTLNRIFKYLGVRTVSVTSELIRMVPNRLDEVIENFQELQSVLQGTSLEHLLYDDNYSDPEKNQQSSFISPKRILT